MGRHAGVCGRLQCALVRVRPRQVPRHARVSVVRTEYRRHLGHRRLHAGRDHHSDAGRRLVQRVRELQHGRDCGVQDAGRPGYRPLYGDGAAEERPCGLRPGAVPRTEVVLRVSGVQLRVHECDWRTGVRGGRAVLAVPERNVVQPTVPGTVLVNGTCSMCRGFVRVFISADRCKRCANVIGNVYRKFKAE